MKKAVITGFFTGIIISGILIGGTYLRQFLPDTLAANLVFLTLFFGSIVSVLWLSLNYYCKSSAVKWMSLNLTGIISSIFAALIVSIYGFMYSNLTDPDYLDDIVTLSKQHLVHTNQKAELLIGGDWSLVNMQVSSAVYHFRDLIVVLFLISLTIAAIYYMRHRNRIPDHGNSRNQELIF